MKQCPCCQGDIYLDEDADRGYEKYLQCGCKRELARVAEFRPAANPEMESSGIH